MINIHEAKDRDCDVIMEQQRDSILTFVRVKVSW